MEHYTCCICAIMKNEHAYLDEWIQHHLDLGIEHIHLYEDRGSEPHDEICNKYDKVILHKLSDSEYDFLEKIGNRKQVTLYNYFILKYHDRYDFGLFIDIDEFLMFEDKWNLLQLLIDTIDEPYKLLWWKVYNANGYIKKQDTLKEKYTCVATNIYEFGNNLPKVLMNFHKILPLKSVHFPISPNVTKIDYKTKYDKAWINHYFTKSWDDWCDRFLKRGDLWPGNRQIWEFFRTNPDMLPIKEKLMNRYFEKKQKYKNIKIVHCFSSIPSKNEWYGVNSYDSLYFDILTYTISFHFAKQTGRKIILYTDNESLKYLNHLDYDRIVIVPENSKPINGNICKTLVYAMEHEDLNTCYISGDFFLGNDILLNMIERDETTELFVNNTFTPLRLNYWDDMVNIEDNVLSYLSPEILTSNETDVDWSFLCFNNEELKNSIIEKYKLNLKKYESSQYCEWWKTYRKFNPDTKLFGNVIGEKMDKEKTFILQSIECYGNKDKQLNEKLDFFESKSVPTLRYSPNFKNTLETLLRTLNSTH